LAQFEGYVGGMPGIRKSCLQWCMFLSYTV